VGAAALARALGAPAEGGAALVLDPPGRALEWDGLRLTAAGEG
jgi:hypothetical protein